MNDKSQLMKQPPPPMMMTHPPQMMPPSSQSMAAQQQMMMNRSYNAWPPQFAAANPPQSNLVRNNNNNNNWKGKRRMEKNVPNMPLTGVYNVPKLPLTGGQSSGGYIPPTLNELQSQNQNRMKARKFYPKKKYNNRFAPYAPRNTTSFIIRAKKSGGIASLVSPCPVTPAVLPTPIFSPSREVLGDTAKEEWGVDGYGSMKGLIRLRSPGNDDDEEEEEGESDVEEHVEVERRLDHDLSRFEMIYPNYSGVEYNNVMENRVDDQDTHIAQLEEENLTLKERLFLMEREMGDLQRRMLFLERRHHVMEEVVENGSDNDSDGGSDVPHMGMGGETNIEVVDYVSRDGGVRDVSMEEYAHDEMKFKENDVNDGVRFEIVANEEIALNEGKKNDPVSDEVVLEKVDKASDETIMNEDQVNIEKPEDMVNACDEENESKILKNEVESKLENVSNDEEMGISCSKNKDSVPVKNEVETKNESDCREG